MIISTQKKTEGKNKQIHNLRAKNETSLWIDNFVQHNSTAKNGMHQQRTQDPLYMHLLHYTMRAKGTTLADA